MCGCFFTTADAALWSKRADFGLCGCFYRNSAIGIPFYIVGTATAMLIREDGKPQYAMCAAIVGAIRNTIFNGCFVLICDVYL